MNDFLSPLDRCGDECGNCALEADHFGPCASAAETPDCYDCGRQWADCTCEGPTT